MKPEDPNDVDRREFLKQAGLTTAGALLAGRAEAGGAAPATTTRSSVSILLAPDDPVASAGPARWAAEELRQALAARNVACRLVAQAGEADRAGLLVVAAGKASPMARDVALADSAEAFTLAAGKLGDRNVLFARGADVRGLVYALTELADIATLSADPVAALVPAAPIVERPANSVRSCMRMFCSDVEDKGWFADRDFWTRYLSMLVAQRFNRFNLSFGLAYDFTTEIRDCYLHFSYPFLLKVPGYDVRATNLGDAERDRNLEILRFVSDEATARGLHFQLGLWTHAYEWTNSPEANHRIVGLTAENHAPYCRDALALLLHECPNIAGVTIRTHGESGVAEGSYDLWRMIFDGARRSGRRVEIDLHAKGLDQTMIDTAVDTGLPVVVTPKFWAEHMGLPYHQAWIRPTEMPEREKGDGLFARSSGSRSFLRYGYGDLMTEDRRYGIVHRIWPGTQRLLVHGDPVLAAAYGRASSFCGSLGAEVMEPLSFKGRKGSGQKGPRTGYNDLSLAPPRDFEKYAYAFRLWGRLLYDPDARPETWQRLLRQQYAEAAPAVEASLAASSRILPLLTTAHMPSAANNHWWPEMPVHMSIVDATHPEPFTDTPSPKRFGAVSPLDPQLFSRIDDCAEELLKGTAGGRYSPAEVAGWLDDLASTAARHLTDAEAKGREDASFRRFAIDTAVGVDLGRFFARKLRAALLFALFERTGDQRLLAAAVELYGSARQAWADIVERTKGVYMDDVSYGIAWYQRGHWADRVAALDKDIAAMQQKTATGGTASRYRELIDAVTRPPMRPSPRVQHTAPASFRRGQALAIELTVADAATTARLLYRHVNQAEPWHTTDLKPDADKHRASIPAEYTDTAFPIQYYFELLTGTPPRAVLYPGLNATWSNQPYLVVRQTPKI